MADLCANAQVYQCALIVWIRDYLILFIFLKICPPIQRLVFVRLPNHR
jgi:hypothetical protein